MEALDGLRERCGPLAVLHFSTAVSGSGESELVGIAAVILERKGPELWTLELSVRRPAAPIDDLRGGLAELLNDHTPVIFDGRAQRRWLDPIRAAAKEMREPLDVQDLFALVHPDAPDLRFGSFLRLVGAEVDGPSVRPALDQALAGLRAIARLGERAASADLRCRIAADTLSRYLPDSPWCALLGKASGPAPIFARPDYVSIEPSEEQPVPFEEKAIAAALRDESRGRRHFANYRVREEQVELARCFVRTLRERKLALLEGGTGVGKSLAYLAAAIPFAVEGRSGAEGGPLLISTRTKLLQDQLIDKDIAAAARFLGHSELLATSIKGRANYICERRYQEAVAEGAQPEIFVEDRFAYAILTAAKALRPYAEVGSMPRDFHQRFPLLRKLIRDAVSRRADQCPRDTCGHAPECPLGARRKALARAQLLVVNHDLLLRWPPDYPAFTEVVVDEVHEFGGVVDEVFASEFRPDEILVRFDEVFGSKKSPGLLSPIRAKAVAEKARIWRADLLQALRALGGQLQTFADEYHALELPPEPLPIFDAVADDMASVAERLVDLAREIGRAREQEEDAGRSGVPLKRAEEDFTTAAGVLRLVFGSLEESVSRIEGLVNPFDRWKLVVRPVSPADRFHEAFLNRLDSFAGVSASLFIEGSSLASLGELELDSGAGGGQLIRSMVSSPFPYSERMRALALRSKGDLVGETARVLTTLATRLSGRTLGLFTSLQRMEQVAEVIGPDLRKAGIELLVPGRGGDDPAALVARFREEPRAVLLGARTFWQGLDLPGEDVQALVIEKLPFEVPTELHKRREARLRSQGINAFAHYTVGKMLLSLRQMIGRLIRTEADRGIAVIVESRHDRRYFKQLQQAMPPGVVLTLGEEADLETALVELGLVGNEQEEGHD